MIPKIKLYKTSEVGIGVDFFLSPSMMMERHPVLYLDIHAANRILSFQLHFLWWAWNVVGRISAAVTHSKAEQEALAALDRIAQQGRMFADWDYVVVKTAENNNIEIDGDHVKVGKKKPVSKKFVSARKSKAKAAKKARKTSRK